MMTSNSLFLDIVGKTRVVIFLMVCLACPSGVLADSAVTIRLRATATVDNDSVCLGDVSDIEAGNLPAGPELSRLKIADAPVAGQSRWIHVDEIKLRLKQAGLDAEQVRIAAAGPVKVLRRFVTLSPEKINAAVKAFALSHAPWKPDQLKVGRLTYGQALTLPPGKVQLRVSAPKHTDWLGPIPFNVVVMVDGQTVGKVTAPATLEVWSDVAVAAKPLGRYQPINADDILIRKMNLARVPSNVITSADQVLGLRTNRSIAANSVLRDDQVESPPLVKRGDVVQVIAESQVLKITAKGLAKESGAKGERIKVMNLGSKKIIYALVVDGQTVQVEF